MNYEKNPAAAERAKAMILSEFPYTSYAEFVKNPKSTGFSKSTTDVEKLYTDAFNLYSQEKFSESQALITQAIEKYPKDALIPKFTLLNAFNTGKTAGKEIMILQLEQLALNYPKTNEGIKAAQMLQYLKSDLQVVPTDEAGNQTEFQGPGRPANVVPISEKAKTPIGRPDLSDDNLSAEEKKLLLEVENIQRQQMERSQQTDKKKEVKNDKLPKKN